MEQTVAGATIFIVGIAFIVFRQKFAQANINYQNRVNRFNFGHRELVITRWIAALVGCISVVVGLCVILGFWKLNL